MLTELREEIARALAAIKSYQLPGVCTKFGLRTGTEDEAFRSKRIYVLERIQAHSLEELLKLARVVEVEFPTHGLSELVEKLSPTTGFQISELTRRSILRELANCGKLPGHLGWLDFLGRVWPLSEIRAASCDGSHFLTTAADSINQHMVRNDDWDLIDALEFLDIFSVSDKRFALLLETAISPIAQDEAQQSTLSASLNLLLQKDHCELRQVAERSGRSIFEVVPVLRGVSGRAKNLIFAADGPKPELVLTDAISNDVAIVKNEQHCLIFDDPIPGTGLTWKHLREWWARKQETSLDDRKLAEQIYRRLERSLTSDPEKLVFREYCRQFTPTSNAPALIPQVYLHYDPYTLKRLGGEKRLSRQRMDFLLLLAGHMRIIIEVDGKQHYAEGDVASPSKYSEMVSADRDLRLAGYEVYRFGGKELSEVDAPERVEAFFRRLFEKHERLRN